MTQFSIFDSGNPKMILGIQKLCGDGEASEGEDNDQIMYFIIRTFSSENIKSACGCRKGRLGDSKGEWTHT